MTTNILVFDAVTGQYRDPGGSNTTAVANAPTRTVLVTGGSWPSSEQAAATDSSTQPAAC